MKNENPLDDFGTELKKVDTIESIFGVGATKECSPCAPESPDDGKPQTNSCQYSVDGLAFWPTGRTIKELKAGVYSVHTCNSGLYFKIESLVIDDLIQFDDGLPKTILDEIEVFWSKVGVFQKYGFLHKRGYLMYSGAGMGKSCLVSQIMSGII